uniref:RING-type domain-containing protein n=1 Tax=Caenorhabditis tropicalis TaxID=1561998 RepID=A0A1I7SYS0_9PELO
QHQIQKYTEDKEKVAEKLKKTVDELKPQSVPVAVIPKLREARQKTIRFRKEYLKKVNEELKQKIEENGGNRFDWQKCQICWENYGPGARPKLLSCGHTICTKCIREVEGRDTVRCPFDRKPCSLAHLRTNFAISDYC